ncbi:MAG: TolB family protein, partial [Acidimicrobiia bacterium]
MPTPRSLVAALGLTLTLAVPAAGAAAAAAAEPATALGIPFEARHLVMFDPATGISQGMDSANGGSFIDADYSSVRHELYTVVFKDGVYTIHRVPQRSGAAPRAVVAHGSRVTVSPDGRFLAYVYHADGFEGAEAQGIAILDLDTGATRRFSGAPVPSGESEDYSVIDNLAISPDSTRLAFDHFDSRQVFVLDLLTSKTMADAHPQGVEGARSPAFLADGTLAIINAEGRIVTVSSDGDSNLGLIAIADRAEAIDADDHGNLMVRISDFTWDDTRQPRPYLMRDAGGTVTRLE